MARTNMLQGDLQDAWAHDTVTNRNLFKAVIMRKSYGSQSSAKSIAEAMNIPSSPLDNRAMEQELQDGEMAVANAFKDFLINNATMQPTMDITILGNTHTMTCNHHLNVGDSTIKYDLFDTQSNSIKRIHHTDTIKKPDLKRFATSVPTMLVHGLDPVAMDATVDAVMDQFGWAIDIHDAIICCCEAAPMARRVFAKQLENIHTNRTTILQDFFKSVGIGASKLSEWNNTVKPLIQPFTGTFTCNPMVLK